MLSPWLFGSAEPWAYLSICLLAGASVVAWLLSLVGDPRPRVLAPGLTVALVVLLAIVFVETLPLPCPIVKVVSPLSAEIQRRRVQLFEELRVAECMPSMPPDHRGWAAISASAASSRRSLFLFAAYLGVFLVLANSAREWRELHSVSMAIAISGFIMAVFALMQAFSGTREIYWFHRPRFGGSIFGPFTNRDHFAGYMNMTFGLTLGLLLTASQDRRLPQSSTWRRRIAWLSSRGAAQVVFLGFAGMLMGAAICLSLSRGGIASLVVSLVVVGGVAVFRGAAPHRGRVIAVLCLLVAAAVVWLGWQPVVRRLGTLADIVNDSSTRTRAVATLDTVRMFRSSPLVGHGFGSFQHVFPVFQSPTIQIGRFLHAHNDYAQLLAEGGILGAVLVTLAAVLFLRHVGVRFAAAATDGRLLACGLAVGILAIAFHSAVDYGLHKPANAFLLSALCGMAVAAVHLPHGAKGGRLSRDHGKELDQRLQEPPSADTAGVYGSEKGLWRPVVVGAAVAGILVCTLLAIAELRALRGELAFARFLQLARLAEACGDATGLADALEGACTEADLIMRHSNGNPDALREVARTFLRWSGSAKTRPDLRLRLADMSSQAAALAVRAAPADYENWLWFARTEHILGFQEQARLCLGRAQELASPGKQLKLLNARS